MCNSLPSFLLSVSLFLSIKHTLLFESQREKKNETCLVPVSNELLPVLKQFNC